MQSNATAYEIAVEWAWHKFIKACDDPSTPYSRLVQLREEWEQITKACPCHCSACET